MAIASGLFTMLIAVIILYGIVAGEILFRFGFYGAVIVDRRRQPVGYALTMLFWIIGFALTGSIFVNAVLPSAPSIWN